MTGNIADIVVAAWDRALRESPDPFDDIYALYPILGYTPPSYRERLDRLPRNCFGDIIPRIVTVKRNIRLLGKPRHPPKLPL